MATELSYDVDVNRAVPAAQQTSAANQTRWSVWYLVQALLGQYGMSGSAAGKWSTYYSCDGATAGTAGDLQDLWGSSYDPTKVVFLYQSQNPTPPTPPSSNFSWFVLKSKIGLGASGSDFSYLIVSCNQAGSVNPTFVFSKTAPTGGSTTARPTATDEVVLVDNVFTFMEGSLVQAHYCHLILSTRGDFFFWTSYTGSTRFYSSLFHVKIQDAKAADLYTTASQYCGSDAPYGAGGFSAAPDAFNAGLLTGPNAFNGYVGNTRGRNFNGAAQVALGSAAPANGAGNILSGAYPAVPGQNESDGTYNEWYCPVYSASPLRTELKGRLPDMKIASGVLAQCALAPNTPSPNYDYVKVGAMWFPWPAPVGPEI